MDKVFGQMKSQYSRALDPQTRPDPAKTIKICRIPSLVNKAWLFAFIFAAYFHISSILPSTWFHMPHASGKLNHKSVDFFFNFL